MIQRLIGRSLVPWISTAFNPPTKELPKRPVKQPAP